MSECKVYRREIVEGSDGDALSRGARAHAEACRACGDELRGRESLRALVRGLGKVEAPSDFEFRLRARMVSAGPAGRRGPLKGLRLVYAFAPVAAAAAFLVVSASLYLRQAPQTTKTEPPSVAVTAPARDGAEGRTAAAPQAGDVRESKQMELPPVEVALGRTGAPARGAGRVSRAASRPSGGVASRAERRERVGQNTAVFSVGAAPVINGRGVTIALKTAAEPMQMILRDERGASRVVPMRSVSFGSQELIAREGVSRQAGAAENEGIW